MLDWCSKCLMFTREEKSLLGHHVESSSKSSLLYSRDTQIELLAKVVKMIGKINMGTFDPDQPRALRLFDLVQSVADENEGHLSTDSEQDDTSDDHDDDNQQERQRVARVQVQDHPIFRLDASMVAGVSRVAHSLSDVVHIKLSETQLLCGRMITSNYHAAMSMDLSASNCVVCATCSKRHQQTLVQS